MREPDSTVTRQTWTAFVAAGLFVAMAIMLAVVPVPFVAWSPGGTENTLGSVKGQPIISIEGTHHLSRRRGDSI